MTLPLEHKPRPQAAPSGPLAELRAVYDAIDDDEAQTRVFDVEGCHAAVRYRRMRIADRLRTQGGDGELWENNAQFLIEACDEILYRDPDTNELGPILPGERVTFALRPGESIPLHQALGADETDIRRSVLRLFQGADQPLLRHAEMVDEWMGSIEERARERFSGG